MGGIYLIQADDQLVEMTESAYDSEDLLQALLAKFPSVLAGDQMNTSSPRRWLLVKREAGIPSEEGGSNRWSMDHLFLDQDGVPTLVEVKRSSDTRIRREVAGQMLDYAANAVVYWPLEEIRARFNAELEVQGRDAAEVISEFLAGADEEEFWQRTKTNLQAGKIRMVFVADVIPPELRRIVEFLNGQMDPAEVLAVEIKQYVGGNLKTLVPRVIGQTSEAQLKKSAVSKRQWDEASFLEALPSSADRAIASKIIDWSKRQGLEFVWGKGQKYGSCGPVLVHDRSRYWLFNIWTNGYVQVQFPDMKAPFDTREAKELVAARLKEIEGVKWAEDATSKYPSIWFASLETDGGIQSLLNTFDWIVSSYRAGKLV